MFTRIVRWIDFRWPLAALLRLGREEEIAGGASFSYTLGSATLFVFLLQAITGVAQLFYYVPTVDHAYDSLNYLRTQVQFGWLIHGLHYWGANAMVVLVGLHMARVFIWGAYKAPRELTWLTGVCLLVLTAGLSFSGAPLPWDERGYWALEVGTSIVGTVPVIGSSMERLLRVGAATGQLTLSRFFVLHVALLPGLLLALVGVHLIAFRRFGSVGPWKDARRQRSGPFWPDQATKDIVVLTLLSLLLIALSVYSPPPITGPADPLDTSYTPKPEWNFLFLYEALKFLPGRLEALGTVGVPTLVILLLVSLPFVDRGPQRSPARRPLIMTGGVLLVVTVATLTVAGLVTRVGQMRTHARERPVGSVSTASASARQGAHLFKSLGCIGCHRVSGTGGTLGPDLSDEALRDRSRQWLSTQIRNPTAHYPKSIMPPSPWLSSQKVQELIDYLLSHAVKPATGPTAVAGATAQSPPASGTQGPPGPAAAMIGSAKLGATLFKRECVACHGPHGIGKVPNPGSEAGQVPALNPISRALVSQRPRVFAENLDRFIQYGSAPVGPSPKLQMPAFGKNSTLTQQEIADVEAYILQLNGVDRAQVAHPGVPPYRFLYAILAMVALTGLGLGIAWIRMRAKRS